VEALTSCEQRKLLECIREIHAQREAERFPHTLLVALARVIPSTFSVFQEIDLRDSSAGLTVQWPTELVRPGDFARIIPHVQRDHPLRGHYARLPRSGACRLSDFLPRRRLHHTGLYIECYRPIGVEHQMTVPLAMQLPVFRGVILNRDTVDFSERERRLLELVCPHAETALRNAKAFTSVRRRLHDAERALDGHGYGLIVVDRGGRVRMRSESARRLEQAYLGKPCPASRLAMPLRTWMEASLTRLVRSDGAVPPIPYVVRRAHEQLVVRLLPDPAKGEHVLLLEAQRLAPPRAELEALGLSPREADVLEWVAFGKTNSEIARILAVSARTVQKHLEHIFEKLGVESRTAAAGRAWEATAGGFGGHPLRRAMASFGSMAPNAHPTSEG
jgi:DNA-binding CsgD family transcriptional regulator/GAF domain-containing protein